MKDFLIWLATVAFPIAAAVVIVLGGIFIAAEYRAARKADQTTEDDE